ncbi:MAG TPA: BlaI/MecI/CopY family transcriptional regulator [Terriglobales bacterium]
MKTAKTVPTDQELEILKVVWQRGQATVREVYEDLLKNRKIAYTTVLTMMGILERKGHLKKTAGPRAYIYGPAQPQSQVVGTMVREFLNRVFNGSAKPLLAHLVREREIGRDELEEIESLLKQRRRKP